MDVRHNHAAPADDTPDADELTHLSEEPEPESGSRSTRSRSSSQYTVTERLNITQLLGEPNWSQVREGAE